MCGYFNDSMWKKVSDSDLLEQFKTVMKQYSGEKYVKIFTSGSFLDDNEIKPKVREEILGRLLETAEKISVESRPEYITDEKLSIIQDMFGSKTFELGVGLETANDFIREHTINKGFNFSDYRDAAETLKEYDAKLKTYVLVKPPFLTEKESIIDSVDTIEKIDSYTDTISLNPTNIQRNTLVYYLWKRKQFRPAWLWSIVEILKESKKFTATHIKCDIVGGGSIRGAHNCGSCDNRFLEAIKKFSLSQDKKIFNDLDCSCKEIWLDQLDIENLCFGSLVDFSGRFP
jgi:radical SAM enzyme (TIGR01210 family)